MITAQASHSLERLVCDSLYQALSSLSTDGFQITAVEKTGDFPESTVVLLTSSSYIFRMMVLIYFNQDAATRACFANGRSASTVQTPQDFTDAMCEVANMCSGALNRELHGFFPHIGLSTPNILERRCADHLQALRPGWERHFEVEISGAPRFHASACLCDYGLIDFHYAPPEHADAVGSGVLEIF